MEQLDLFNQPAPPEPVIRPVARARPAWTPTPRSRTQCAHCLLVREQLDKKKDRRAPLVRDAVAVRTGVLGATLPLCADHRDMQLEHDEAKYPAK